MPANCFSFLGQEHEHEHEARKNIENYFFKFFTKRLRR